MTGAEARRRLKEATGRGVRVAVVDSGWSASSEDPRVMPVVEPGGADEAGLPGDAVGHGTWCALRVLQVAPEAEIVPVRVFRDRLETSVPLLYEAIQTARTTGARVINLSLATHRADAIHPLYEVCERARRDGVVVVAAAHNRGGRAVPAYLEPVLSVGHGPHTELLEFTYEADAAIECTAASGGVPCPGVDGRPIRRGGSSTAAATLSGIVARLLEVAPGDLDHVRHLLSLTATPLRPAGPSLGSRVEMRKGGKVT